MVWFKVCDKISFGPKHMAAGNEACGAWVRAGSWISEHLTDGVIPADVAHAIAPKRVWKKLVEAKAGKDVGLVVERDGGYELHDYLVYNRSAAEVRADRTDVSEKRREAGRRGAAARWHQDASDDGKRMAKAMANECDGDAKPMAPIPIPDHVVGEVARAPDEPDPPPTHPAGEVLPSPQADAISMAYELSQRGDAWAADLCERVASGRTLTKGQREKLAEVYARLREGDAAAAKLAAVKAAGFASAVASGADSDLAPWVAQRWVDARQKRGLGAQTPDPKFIAELCALATAGANHAAPDREGWLPTVKQIAAFWIKRYLGEHQDRAGGVTDSGYPLAWLPSRCREYPLPKRREVKPDTGGTAPAETAPSFAPESRPAPQVSPPPIGFGAALDGIGAGASGSAAIRARPRFEVVS